MIFSEHLFNFIIFSQCVLNGLQTHEGNINIFYVISFDDISSSHYHLIFSPHTSQYFVLLLHFIVN